MENAEVLRRQADHLRKSGEYEDALPIYQALWERTDQAGRHWDGWAYGYCLQKTGQYAQALQIARQVYQLKPGFLANRRVYAWCLFKLEIQKPDAEIARAASRFFRAARAILALSPPGDYSPAARTILRVVSFYHRRKPYPAEIILAWTGCLAAKDLSRQPPSNQQPSELETWYCERCRALFQLERYSEFRETAHHALADLDSFHRENDWWLHYRLALADARTGNLAAAVEGLKVLLAQRSDWFILNELAQALIGLDRAAEALPYAAAALLAPAEPVRKAGLLYQVGALLDPRPGQATRAWQHYALAARLLLVAGRPLPVELARALAGHHLSVQDLPTIDFLYLNLQGYWQQLQVENWPAATGKVARMRPQGGGGWIAAEGGQDYPFEVSEFLGNPTLLRPGLPVQFRVAPVRGGKPAGAVYIQLRPKSDKYHLP